MSDKQGIFLRLGPKTFEALNAQCPESLSPPAFCALLVEQGLTSNPVVASLPTCRAGAGNRFGYDPQLPYQFPPELEVTNTEAPAEAVEAVPAVKPKVSKPKSVNAPLKKFESLILEFWRVKKGSKGETAWKRLQGQLQKFLDAYGESIVEDQLELAINGKWAGIEFSRYEQFKPAGKHAPARKKRTEEEIDAQSKADFDHFWEQMNNG